MDPSDIIHKDDDSSSSSDDSDVSNDSDDEEEERGAGEEKIASATAMNKLMNVDGARSSEVTQQYKKPRIEEL